MSKDYFRNRPFLIVNMTRVPRDGVKTHVKGYMDDASSLKTMERVSIVDRLNKAQNAADIVLDLINAKVVRNRTEAAEDTLFQEYASRYQDKIEQALKIWAYREVQKLSPEEKAEAEAEHEAALVEANTPAEA